MPAARPAFVTRVRSAESARAARLLLESLRAFGGAMAPCPAWVFAADGVREQARRELAGVADVAVLPLAVPCDAAPFLFAEKVFACARAEQVAGPDAGSLVWMDPECLVAGEPLLLDLGGAADAAFRPVHVRNVGLPPAEPLDPFWSGICAAIGTPDVPGTVVSFVDGQVLRSYFNSHCFSVNPRVGLMARWWEVFQRLVAGAAFRRQACPDEAHRVFLFQAVLSVLVASTVGRGRIRVLPPSYSYPYHLHAKVPTGRRPAALNDLAVVVLEDRLLDPAGATDIEIREPLRSWLASRPAGAGA